METTVLCRLCNRTYRNSELVPWKHKGIDGGSTFHVCPCCAANAVRLELENDRYTADKLGEAIVMIDEKED